MTRFYSKMQQHKQPVHGAHKCILNPKMYRSGGLWCHLPTTKCFFAFAGHSFYLKNRLPKIPSMCCLKQSSSRSESFLLYWLLFKTLTNFPSPLPFSLIHFWRLLLCLVNSPTLCPPSAVLQSGTPGWIEQPITPTTSHSLTEPWLK